MSLLGRYIRHTAPGTTGATGLVAADNPWGAGRSTLLRAEAQHLHEVAPVRQLWTSPGVEGFYRPARSGTLFTSSPTPADIDWNQTRKTGGLGLYLGHHWAWRSPLRLWPRISCRFTVKVASTYTVGLVLCVSAGSRGPLEATSYVGATYTDVSFAEYELAFNLSDAAFAREAYAPSNGTTQSPLDEQGTVYGFSVYLGGYVNSNSGMSPASVVGVTLGLGIAS